MMATKLKRSLIGFVVLVASAIGTTAFGQGLNNLWLSGYQSDGDIPFGGSTLDFHEGFPMVDAHDRAMNFSRTSATISDHMGNLILYTNGIYLADRTDQPMLNGEGLNPSVFTSALSESGLTMLQGNFALPISNDSQLYSLIHITADTLTPQGVYKTLHIYRSRIDMALNSGNGAVIQKNDVILNDSLDPEGLSCIQHANGRDWWIVAHGSNTDVFSSILVTDNAVFGPYHQHIGETRMGWTWNGTFSLDGSRYVSIDGVHGMDLFDFDRCSGEFYNSRHVNVTSANTASTAAFSPSGNRLYVTAYDRVYQFDCLAPDIASSITTVAVWDSTYDNNPVFRTNFWVSRLGPDGKIYITTGNGTRYLHVINFPDELGMACDFHQHALMLPTYNDNTIPYHPNYWLGPVDGTVCDSLGINVGLSPLSLGEGLGVRAFPNPNQGAVTLNYAPQPGAGELDILDADGRMVLHEALPPWSSLHRLALGQVTAGLYVARLRWKEQSTTVRIAVTH